MNVKKILDENADVTLTRKQARQLVDIIDDDVFEDLGHTIDNAQGEADDNGKTAFVIIKITGERL